MTVDEVWDEIRSKVDFIKVRGWDNCSVLVEDSLKVHAVVYVFNGELFVCLEPPKERVRAFVMGAFIADVGFRSLDTLSWTLTLDVPAPKGSFFRWQAPQNG